MFHKKNNHFLKHLLSLTITLIFFLQTTLQAYTHYPIQLDLEQQVLGTTLNTGDTTLSAGEHILMQSVTGSVSNLHLESANVILQSLNNVSHHETTSTTNGLLTTTTTMQGSNIETVAGTDIVVGGKFTINGDDLTAELYDGVLTSQATREDPAKAQEAIKDALNASIHDYLASASEEGTYSGYSSSAISTIQTQAVSKTWDESTTSLNALGQLVVQAIVAVSTGGISTGITGAMGAAGSSTVVQAAVSSVVNQLSTELLTSVITGESPNIDLGNLVTGYWCSEVCSVCRCYSRDRPKSLP